MKQFLSRARRLYWGIFNRYAYYIQEGTELSSFLPIVIIEVLLFDLPLIVLGAVGISTPLLFSIMLVLRLLGLQAMYEYVMWHSATDEEKILR